MTTLQEIIMKVVADAGRNGKNLTTAEIATIINHKKLYQRKDGKLLTDEHILTKINETQDRYEIAEGKVCFSIYSDRLWNTMIDLSLDDAYRILYTTPVLQVLRKDEATELVLILAVYKRLRSYEVTAEHLEFLKEDNKEELIADLNILAYELPMLKVFFSTFASLLNQLPEDVFEAVMGKIHFIVGENVIDNKTFLDHFFGRHGSVLTNLVRSLNQTSMYQLPEATFSAVEKAEVQTLTVAYNVNVIIAHALLSTKHLQELTCLYHDQQQTVYMEVLAFFSGKKLMYQIKLFASDADEFYQNTLYCGPYGHKPDFEQLSATSSMDKSLREWLYVDRLLKKTLPKGTVFALLPSLRLTDGSSKNVRKQLIQNYDIEQISQLQGTAQRQEEIALEIRTPLNLLRIKNKKPQRDAINLAKPVLVREPVLDFTPRKSPDTSLPSEYCETYEPRIVAISFEEIASNDFRLLPSQYIHEGKDQLIEYLHSLPVQYVKQVGEVVKDTYSSKGNKLPATKLADDKVIAVSTKGGKMNAVLVKSGESVSISQTVFIPDESIILAKYLILQLNNAFSQTQYEMRIIESATISSITTQDFLKIILSVPPLEEQQRFLKEVQGLNLQSEQKLKNLKEDEFAMMNSLQHSVTPSIGHIRTYVNSIRAYIARQHESGQIVDFNHASVPPEMVDSQTETVGDVFTKIENITTSLAQSFDTIKAIATIDKAVLNFEVIDVRKEIQQVISDLEDTEYVRISKGEEVRINVDRSLFREIIQNLIYNSQRHAFADSSKKVIFFDIHQLSQERLILEGVEEASAMAVIEYWDNGKGLGDNFTLEDFFAYGKGKGKSRNTGLGGYLIGRIFQMLGNSEQRPQLLPAGQIKSVKLNGKLTYVKTGFHLRMLLPLS